MENITPKQKELLEFLRCSDPIYKDIRNVFVYAVQLSCKDGIPPEICNNLSMLAQLADIIEEVKTCKS